LLGVATAVLGAAWWIARAMTVAVLVVVLALLVFGVFEGPALVGYHRCDASDYLLGAHGFKLLGTAWCKQ
jgi:hypothetical protein